MNIFTYLAHAGHDHAEEAVKASRFSDLLAQPLFLWSALVVGVLLIALFAQYVFKLQLTTTLLVISVFLIIFSVFTYQSPGIYTAVALSVGFGLVLVTTLLGLSSKS